MGGKEQILKTLDALRKRHSGSTHSPRSAATAPVTISGRMIKLLNCETMSFQRGC